jgi:hypothetical protein
MFCSFKIIIFINYNFIKDITEKVLLVVLHGLATIDVLKHKALIQYWYMF